MEKTTVILFLLLALSPLPVITFRKMWWAMKFRQEHAQKQRWAEEYETGIFGILMGGAFGLTLSPYLIYAYHVLVRQ